MTPQARRRVLHVYVAVVTAAGAVAFASVWPIPFDRPWLFLFLFGFSVVTSVFKVSLPLASGRASMSVAYCSHMAALMMLGVGPADLVTMVGAWAQCSYRTRTRFTLRQKLFNMASLVLSVHLAGFVIGLWHGNADGGITAQQAEVLLLATAAFFLSDSLAAGIAVTLSTGRSLVTLSSDFMWGMPAYFLGTGVAALFAEAVDHGMYALAALVLVPSAFVYRTYRQYLDRLEAEQRLASEHAEKHSRALTALAAEKEMLAATVAGIGDGVVATDAEGRVVLLNPVAEALTGWSRADAEGCRLELILQTHPLLPRLDAMPVRGDGTGRRSITTRTSLTGRDATTRQVEVTATAIGSDQAHHGGSVLVVRDLTESLRAEEERIRTSKLESLGALAGGIAHDFNNLLTAVVGQITIARETASVESAGALSEAELACLRARSLTRQLLTFAKGGTPLTRPLRLGPVVEASVQLALRGASVISTIDIAPDLWTVDADEGQLGQVVSNIVINAKQAMPEGGHLAVRCENLEVAEGSEGSFPPGAWIHVVIKDDGCGMPGSVLSRIFDPYFTTKPEGTGLGLAVSHAIVKNHRGRITAESVPGKGSAFHILLPRSTQVPETPALVPAAVVGRGSGIRVLLMDDDAMVRKVTAALLTRGGFECLTACDGREAIERFRDARESGHPVAAVILDLTVPGGMGGAEALGHLRREDPAVPALVLSGYADSDVLSEYGKYGFSARLAKPFAREELLAAVYGMLAPDHDDDEAGWRRAG